jgi:hypothetical protein
MKIFYLILLIFLPFLIYSQGLIINEISNGDSGNREYFELVVIGSTSNPTISVDLGGWIIDDNNGDFEGVLSGVGTAQGHIRIKPGCLSNVKPGSIILIYNSADVNPTFGITPDPLDFDGDCVYILPISDLCLDNTSNLPTTTNPLYTPVSYAATRIWDRVGFRNDGDAAQVRSPNGSFFHGFSYGDVSTPFPTFPFGGSSFNIITGSGLQRNYFFNSGSFGAKVNFSRGVTPTNETPGQPNNDANRYFINSLRMGTYNYSNLLDPINIGSSTTLVDCGTILPIGIIEFKGTKINDDVNLQWTLDDVTEVNYIELEKSSNGYDLYPISEIYPYDLTMNYIDDLTYSENYYRLKIVEYSGDITYSNIINISNKINDDILIYPNPTKDILNIKTTKNINRISLFNELGVEFVIENPTSQIDLSSLSKGIYIVKINIDENTIIKKIILI